MYVCTSDAFHFYVVRDIFCVVSVCSDLIDVIVNITTGWRHRFSFSRTEDPNRHRHQFRLECGVNMD